MAERKSRSKPKEPAYASDKPSGIGKDKFVGYGNPKAAMKLGPLAVYYRTKIEGSVEQRRYYLGFIQIAYVRIEGANYLVYPINGDGQAPLLGVLFNKEADLNAYLERELKGEQK